MNKSDDADDYVMIQPEETPQRQTARMLQFAKEAVEAGMYLEAASVVKAVRIKIEQLIYERRTGMTLEAQGRPFPLDSYSDLEKDHNNVKKHI